MQVSTESGQAYLGLRWANVAPLFLPACFAAFRARPGFAQQYPGLSLPLARLLGALAGWVGAFTKGVSVRQMCSHRGRTDAEGLPPLVTQHDLPIIRG
jgi:hypothetical protein